MDRPAPMSNVELARLVQLMRASQCAFFKTKRPEALSRSRDLEKQVDKAVARILETPSLFDDEAEG